MKNKSVLLFVIVCLVPCLSFAGGKDKQGKGAFELLETSLETIDAVSFDGVLTFYRKTDRSTLNSSMKICCYPDKKKRMEVLTPEILKHYVVIDIRNKIWATPIDENQWKEIDRQLQHHWFRIFKDNTATIDRDDMRLIKGNYDIFEKGSDTVANRQAVKILLKPKSKWPRPSLMLWIDQEQTFPIKYEKYNYKGELQESLAFQFITFSIEQDACDFSTEGLVEIPPPPHIEKGEEAEPIQLDFTPYLPERLPQGFEQRKSHTFIRDGKIVHRTIFYDGIAYLVFYQRKQTEEEKAEQMKEPEDTRYKVKKLDELSWEAYYRDLGGVRVLSFGDISPDGIAYALYQLKPAEVEKQGGK